MESEGTSISLLKHQDFYLFQDLIKSSWSENHIFAKNRSVFDWQHKGPSNYYYMSAKKEKEIIAAQGIIPQNHFDESLPADQIFLAFWIAKKKQKSLLVCNATKKLLRNSNQS